MCYSVTALYRRYRAVTDFETRVTISIESVCCPGQSAGSRIASAQVHLRMGRGGCGELELCGGLELELERGGRAGAGCRAWAGEGRGGIVRSFSLFFFFSGLWPGGEFVVNWPNPVRYFFFFFLFVY